ncbi:MAG: dicarboxylate/amino acid:cation symporter [Polyangiaceae bacterium]|jgi:Na+/H+-dicarboxylate symporter|nr:dicarboxylate/amino acid:cation symporter [Polyangiaceae bacterium]
MTMTRPWRWPLHGQILGGLVVGAVGGGVLGRWAVGGLAAGVAPERAGAEAFRLLGEHPLFTALQVMGDLFLRALKLTIVPLVMSSIVLAIARMGGTEGFRRLGLKTLAYYAATSLIAILIGLVLINLAGPGFDAAGRGILEGRDLSLFEEAQKVVAGTAKGRSSNQLVHLLRQMVPTNVVAAAAEAQLLGIIVVAMVTGYQLSRLEGPPQQVLLHGVEGIYTITMRLSEGVLRLAPIGVVGLLGATVAEQYARLVPDQRFEAFARGIGLFAVVSVVGLALHLFVVLPLLLAVLGRVSPLRHFQAMAPALFTAFSSASSSATLPVTIDCVERRAGVSSRVASFTLPLGATVNMDGTALYECVAALFICQAFGVHLNFSQQFTVVLLALLTSVGVAGVPAASLVAIIIILEAVQAQLPPGTSNLLAGLGLLFVFDRPLDMCRTSVNMFSDSVGAVIIARSEGESPLQQGPPGAPPGGASGLPLRGESG